MHATAECIDDIEPVEQINSIEYEEAQVLASYLEDAVGSLRRIAEREPNLKLTAELTASILDKRLDQLIEEHGL